MRLLVNKFNETVDILLFYDIIKRRQNIQNKQRKTAGYTEIEVLVRLSISVLTNRLFL